MYTQCPECLTIYRIPVDALTRAHGRARCGVCRAEFDALATLVDHLPAEPVGKLERHAAGPLPILDVPAMRPKDGQHDLFAPDEEDDVAPAPDLRASARDEAARQPLAGLRESAAARRPAGPGDLRQPRLVE